MSPSHAVAPGQKALQLDIPLVLPGVDDARDGCVERLQERLRAQNGVALAHLEERAGQTVLCLHYDPVLVPLERLQRVAREEGAAISERFKHQSWPLKGMDCASCAASIEHVVNRIPGVLHASVNYSVGKLKVEFDSTQTSSEIILGRVGKLGYRAVSDAEVSSKKDLSTKDSPQSDGTFHDFDAPKHSGGWLHSNAELALSFACGALLLLGFVGEQFLKFPREVTLPIFLLSYLAGGYKLTRHTVPALLHGRFDVDFLMLAGAVGAAILNQWAEGAFLLFLFSLGHALEHRAMERARDAIHALGRITPKTARVRRGEIEQEIGVDEVRIGDIAIVRPGDRLATEGVVFAGHSSLDQSPITGESVPVEKGVGDLVFAGSINGEGALEVQVTKLSRDTTMARVVQMVEEAQNQKSQTQTFAEKFERVFVPSILGLVVLAAIVPPLLGWLSWETAFLRAISTLVAASPCALALATPAAVLAGIARAAQGGVLIKGGIHLENLGALNAIAFDKTGTLTRGRPEISDVICASGVDETELLQIAASVETRSNHPLARAVVRRAQVDEIALLNSGELHDFAGRGVTSEIDGALIRIGNARLFDEAGIVFVDEMRTALERFGDEGKPAMIVGREDEILGILAFADTLRPEAPEALKRLSALGISSTMLTGDNARVAKSLAARAGVSDFRADLLPADKVAALKELLLKHKNVAMIGDGVNDAPALATATVGIAMGAGGSDVALETADVALMGDDLNRLPFAVALSRQSRAIIRQNLWIALGVIALLVPSTLFGLARLGVAVTFHEGSTLVVVANALRLLRFRFDEKE